MTFRNLQLALAALGGLVLFVLVRRAGVDNVAATLAGVSPAWLALWLLTELAIFIGFSLRWHALLVSLGSRVAFSRLLGFRVAGLAVGTLTPGAKLGGEPLRAYLLAREQVPAGTAIASVTVDRALEIVANLVFAVGYCALFALRDRTTAGRMLVVILASGLAFVAGVAWLLRRLRRGGSIVPARMYAVLDRLGASQESIRRTDDSLRELIFARPGVLAGALAGSLFLNFLIFAEYAILFVAFGTSPTLPDLAGALLGVGLAHALPIPASLGALEGAQAALFEFAGDGTRMAIVAATVARIRDLCWTLPGVAWLGWNALRSRGSGLS